MVRALIVPPMEDGRCAINGPDKWDQGRRRGVKGGEDGAARHAIIRRAAIEGDDRCPGVKINCSTEQPSQSIDPRACLERELVGARGNIKGCCKLARQDAGCQSAQRIARGYPAGPATWLG